MYTLTKFLVIIKNNGYNDFWQIKKRSRENEQTKRNNNTPKLKRNQLKNSNKLTVKKTGSHIGRSLLTRLITVNFIRERHTETVFELYVKVSKSKVKYPHLNKSKSKLIGTFNTFCKYSKVSYYMLGS